MLASNTNEILPCPALSFSNALTFTHTYTCTNTHAHTHTSLQLCWRAAAEPVGSRFICRCLDRLIREGQACMLHISVHDATKQEKCLCLSTLRSERACVGRAEKESSKGKKEGDQKGSLYAEDEISRETLLHHGCCIGIHHHGSRVHEVRGLSGRACVCLSLCASVHNALSLSCSGSLTA